MADERSGDNVRERGINANSILILILMGICSWALYTQVATGKDVTAIKTSQDFFGRALDEVKSKMVTKPELDNKVMEIQLRQVEFENRILKTVSELEKSRKISTPGAHDDN